MELTAVCALLQGLCFRNACLGILLAGVHSLLAITARPHEGVFLEQTVRTHKQAQPCSLLFSLALPPEV